ncbi:MAG: enoyl-CoA hydratase/isomerase family protein [Bacteroidetes bacterium]|nr:enoyl-CoA hydratase/isomerase family protein [Bacteroidota bacterium]
MTYSDILFSVEDQVGKIILNRTGEMNCFNARMSAEVQDALINCRNDNTVRAVYLTGAGRTFSAGQDLKEFLKVGLSASHLVKSQYNPIALAIRSIEKPVICGVNGIAAGAGANIVFCCDIVVAARSAVFVEAFTKIGLVPDSGGTFFLPRLVGLHRAASMTMLNEPVTAAQALDWGLVYRVYDDDKLQSEGMELAKKLSAMPTKTIGMTKRLFNSAFSNDLNAQLAMEAELQEFCGNTYDHKEGVKAFLEKRKPVFRGE